MTPAQLTAYCARLGLDRPPAPDLAGLTALLAAHCMAIPFENIDVQLARAPSLDPDAIFAKLVEQRRGGWCYEHNGLLGSALAAIGFAVQRVCGGILRPGSTEPAMGSHLALIVRLDRPWLVDAGFGRWLRRPLPLEPGAWPQPVWPVAIGHTDRGDWRVQVDLGKYTMSYDFAAVPADEALIAAMCTWQATDPESNFVQNLVVMRDCGATNVSLRGRVLVETCATVAREQTIDSAQALVAVLAQRFGLDVPEVASLWPAIVARHAALCPDQAAAPTT